MPTIVFTSDYKVKDGSDGYKKGDELTCNHASANHFKSRNVAIDKRMATAKLAESHSSSDSERAEPERATSRGRKKKQRQNTGDK